MANNIPRPEHPNPQCVRDDWINLNGEWDFEIDNPKSGFDREFYKRRDFSSKIIVPFCPESSLSGIGNLDFMACVWYGRTVEITPDRLSKGKRTILHIGACDYETHLYVNSNKVGIHLGGYSSFSFDITDFLIEGENYITIAAVDDTRSPLQGTGKQSMEYRSHRCYYTRTTGIWQTVWLETIPNSYIKEFKFYPNATEGTVTVMGDLVGTGEVKIDIFFGEKLQAEASITSNNGHFATELILKDKHLWDIGEGNLYDVRLTFGNDEIKSYFGLRDISFDGMKFILNGRSVFQRLVLDQGYYPDGIYTAPNEEALVKDIEISLAAGFNGARLHQKVFEPRFLYHADKMGYLVWGEYGDWGLDYSNAMSFLNLMPEWLEILRRDFNHPSIVGWCPMNECWDYNGHKRGIPAFFKCIYEVTKAYDSTRPVIDTSGGYHVITDVFDHHDYEQNPERIKEKYDSLATNGTFELPPRFKAREKYEGQPFFISEYGGIGWSRSGKGWGYRDVNNAEDFHKGYEGLTKALLDNPSMFGFCYTQLYDVEQEENGLYFYDRTPKADIDFIRKVTSSKAAIEEE